MQETTASQKCIAGYRRIRRGIPPKDLIRRQGVQQFFGGKMLCIWKDDSTKIGRSLEGDQLWRKAIKTGHTYWHETPKDLVYVPDTTILYFSIYEALYFLPTIRRSNEEYAPEMGRRRAEVPTSLRLSVIRLPLRFEEGAGIPIDVQLESGPTFNQSPILSIEEEILSRAQDQRLLEEDSQTLEDPPPFGLLGIGAQFVANNSETQFGVGHNYPAIDDVAFERLNDEVHPELIESRLAVINLSEDPPTNIPSTPGVAILVNRTIYLKEANCVGQEGDSRFKSPSATPSPLGKPPSDTSSIASRHRAPPSRPIQPDISELFNRHLRRNHGRRTTLEQSHAAKKRLWSQEEDQWPRSNWTSPVTLAAAAGLYWVTDDVEKRRKRRRLSESSATSTDGPNGASSSGSDDIVHEPETRPLSQEQLIAEVNGIYAGLIMVEAKCIEVDRKMTKSDMEFDAKQWQALIALHRTLLHEHHDFLLASQHLVVSHDLKQLADKYEMPTQAPPSEDSWRECLQDISRCRGLKLKDTFSTLRFQIHDNIFSFLDDSDVSSLCRTSKTLNATYQEIRLKKRLTEEAVRERNTRWSSRELDCSEDPEQWTSRATLGLPEDPIELLEVSLSSKSKPPADGLNSLPSTMMEPLDPCGSWLLEFENLGVEGIFESWHSLLPVSPRNETCGLTYMYSAEPEKSHGYRYMPPTRLTVMLENDEFQTPDKTDDKNLEDDNNFTNEETDEENSLSLYSEDLPRSASAVLPTLSFVYENSEEFSTSKSAYSPSTPASQQYSPQSLQSLLLGSEESHPKVKAHVCTRCYQIFPRKSELTEKEDDDEKSDAGDDVD
ncbi:hypothetical protein B7494_g3538 [Chlorociboria aeruginascens]|nr:hypothetical protein B7494_g3538 [Chlorociboria aeruginascens]